MSGARSIRLLLAGVDGALLTKDKGAARELHQRLTGAIAGFNGGVFVKPDLSVIERR